MAVASKGENPDESHSVAHKHASEACAPQSDKSQYLALLRHNITLLKRSVAHVEQRYMARVIRSLPYVRTHVQEKADVLALVVQEALPEASTYREELLSLLRSHSSTMWRMHQRQ